MGVLLGESGARDPVRGRRARARARLRRPRGHPGRGWSHHQLAGDAALDPARPLAGDDRRDGLGGASSRSAPTTSSACRGSSPSCSARCARRPTRPRCSRCSAWCRCRGGSPVALEAESGLNDAPTVVLVTLISTGAAAEHGRLVLAGIIVFELVVGVADRPRRRLRRRLDHAPRRAAVLRSLPDRGALPGVRWRTAPRPPCMPPASPRSTSPRWCSATRSSRTGSRPGRSPRASPRWPRSGCSSCSACCSPRAGSPSRSSASASSPG